jgi:VanZ family protein
MLLFNASPWPWLRSATRVSPRWRRTIRWFLWVCLFAGWVAVGVVSVLPQPTAPDLGGWDKWGHFVCYAVLGANAAFVCRGWRRAALGIGLVLFGITVEALQALCLARDGNAIDAMANGAGVIVGLFVVPVAGSVLCSAWQRRVTGVPPSGKGRDGRDRFRRSRP